MAITLNGVGIDDLVVFDPADIPRLFAQDEMIERGWTTGFNVPVHERTNEQLAHEVVALRNALLLPFSERFLGFIGGQWRRACEEVSIRMLAEPQMWRELPAGAAEGDAGEDYERVPALNGADGVLSRGGRA